MTATKHAILSPSKASMWLECVGAPAFASLLPAMPGSKASEYGTAAHELAEIILTEEAEAAAGFVGRLMSNGVEVDEEMASGVQKYVDIVRAIPHDVMLIEQPLDLFPLTGEESAEGTADAVLLGGDELVIVDLKFGTDLVEVEDNPQLKIYALAALLQYQELEEFKTVRLIIAQPRRNSFPEIVYEADDLLYDFWEEVKAASAMCWDQFAILADSANDPKVLELTPGEKQCKWCPAGRQGKCHAQDKKVAEVVELDFDVLPDGADDMARLEAKYSAVELVKRWLKQTEAAMFNALKNGEKSAEFMLALGRAGNRAWTDEAEAEKVMAAMKIPRDDMYTKSLIGPASAEKLYEIGSIGPRQWPKLKALITRPAPKPAVVKRSSGKPEYIPEELDFDTEGNESEESSD